MTEIGLNGLHIVSDEMKAFVAEFQRLKSSGDLKAATLKCANLCYRTWNKKRKSRFRVNLVDLFLGIAEDDEAVQECKLGSIVVHNGVVTAPLGSLLLDEVSLETQDEDSVRVLQVFSQGQSVFLHALTDKTDMFTGLLERAFAWALSCRAAKQRQLIFGSKRCGFKCEAIQAGRVFDTNGTLNSELVDQLRKGVLYYADESKQSHPGADLWFIEDSGALVLVEVGGTSLNDKARKKARELSKTVASEQSRAAYDIAAVVLLPNVGPDVRGDSDEFLPTVVAGEVAQRLLGGLAQLLTWLD